MSLVFSTPIHCYFKVRATPPTRILDDRLNKHSIPILHICLSDQHPHVNSPVLAALLSTCLFVLRVGQTAHCGRSDLISFTKGKGKGDFNVHAERSPMMGRGASTVVTADLPDLAKIIYTFTPPNQACLQSRLPPMEPNQAFWNCCAVLPCRTYPCICVRGAWTKGALSEPAHCSTLNRHCLDCRSL